MFHLWARTLQAIAAENRNAPFDAIHAFWADEPGWVAALAGSRLGVPTVISIAGGELIGLRDIGYGAQLLPGRRALIHWGLRRADHVTAGSRYLLNIAHSHLPQRQWRKLSLAPLGVDTSLFSPPPSAKRTGEGSGVGAIVLNVGSLTPVKDQETLLRAMAKIPPARLRIAGSGPLKTRLNELAKALGIEGRVELLGEIDHGQMPAMYRAADVFAQASRHEAQGMAALEAAACGLSVVGTAVGVLPEIGRAVPVGDADALADAIRFGLSGVGESAREKVVEEYSLARAVERFLRLYSPPP